jgi:peptidoglycan/LPS O-acetylase OafA/YrhL
LGRLTGVQAARGIAALLVVAMHSRDHLLKAFGAFPFADSVAFGHAGVDFFFVLSGFIILHVHEGDIGRPASLGRYLQRRFTRVYPLYWAVLAVTVLLGVIRHPPPPLADLAGASLLLPLRGDLPVSIAWTLQHEIVFYAAFAVLIVNRRLGVALFGCWLAWIGCGVLGVVGDATEGWLVNVHSVFDVEFFLGMLAAWTLRRVKVPAPRAMLLVGGLAFLAVGIAENMSLARPLADATHLGYGVGAMLMVIGMVEAERRGRLRAPGFLVTLGGASYALYLTHLMASAALWQALRLTGLADTLPVWLQFAGFVLVSVAVGLVASWTVEARLNRFARWAIVAPQVAARPSSTA